MAPIKALVFDFAHVLCSWKRPNHSCVPPELLRLIMSSDIWHDYERGRFTQEECYAKVAERFPVSAIDMEYTLVQARKTVQIHHDTLAFIKQVKDDSAGYLMVYGMTNTPRTEQNIIHSISSQWPGLFDSIYISGNVGMRKPDICFYEHVLKDINLPGDSVILIDDRLENVLAAQSIGMGRILFQNLQEFRQQIMNIFGDPVSRGSKFLATNAKRMHSVTNTGDTIEDNFAQLLILELTQDRNLVQLEAGEKTWNYFIGAPKLTTEKFPNDMDTTSMALSVLPMSESLVTSVINDMLHFKSEDGVFMTYFDSTRPRVDAAVCVNVLYLFLQNGREQEALPTFNWVLKVLLSRAYLDGTRYYQSPDIFLFFLTRLSGVIRSKNLLHQLTPPLTARVQERVGAPGNAISLAARVIVCKTLGINNDRDIEILKGMQCEDGSWPVEWVYRFASFGLDVGNRGLSTAFAVKAIQAPYGTLEMTSFQQLSELSRSFGIPWNLPRFFLSFIKSIVSSLLGSVILN